MKSIKNSIDIAISPCPNDTFIFESLIDGSSPFPVSVNPSFYDIDTLNRLAIEEKYPIIKASSAIYPKIAHNYDYLSSGGAFAYTDGPLVIANRQHLDITKEITTIRVATPSIDSSSFRAFSYIYGPPKKVFQLPYDKIAEAVANDFFDVGILIHESRFTFQEQFKNKLFTISDLQKLYFLKTGHLLPLGLIYIHKAFSKQYKIAFEQALQKSITIAKQRASPLSSFIKYHAKETNGKELSDHAIKEHIKLYVTDDTFSLTPLAIESLLFLFTITPKL